MSKQYPNPPFEANVKPPMPVYVPPTAWKSAPAAVRFAIWVWAIGVIASLVGAGILAVVFVLGMNVASLSGN